MRASAIERLKLGIEMADRPITNEVFQEIIAGILEEGIFTVNELADRFLYAKSTIEHWSRGRNLPRQAIKGAIFRGLKKELSNKLSKLS